MEAFARVLEAVGAAASAAAKVGALSDYFRQVPASDACHAVRLLAARRSPRFVRLAVLRLWAAEAAALPLWLVDQCHEVAVDLGETLALIMPPALIPHTAPSPGVGSSAQSPEGQPRIAAAGAQVAGMPLGQLVEDRLLPLGRVDAAAQRELVLRTWADLDARQRVVWNRLVTGTFRIGVPRAMLARALAGVAGVDPMIAEWRLMGDWHPSAEGFRRLVSPETTGDDPTRPYPFHPTSGLEGPASVLGDPRDWQIEWSWRDARLQLIRRAGRTILWSHEAGILTDILPELARAVSLLPDGTVLEGVVLTRQNAERPAGIPAPQSPIRREAARSGVGAGPTAFIARDLLESGGVDWRARPLAKRREELEAVIRTVGSAWIEAWKQSRGHLLEQGELFDELAICPRSPSARQTSQARQETEGGAGADTATCLTARPSDPRRTDAVRSMGQSHFSSPPPCPLRLSPLVAVAHWEGLLMCREPGRALGAVGLLLRHRDSAYGGRRQEDTWHTLGFSGSERGVDCRWPWPKPSARELVTCSLGLRRSLAKSSAGTAR